MPPFGDSTLMCEAGRQPAQTRFNTSPLFSTQNQSNISPLADVSEVSSVSSIPSMEFASSASYLDAESQNTSMYVYCSMLLQLTWFKLIFNSLQCILFQDVLF